MYSISGGGYGAFQYVRVGLVRVMVLKRFMWGVGGRREGGMDGVGVSVGEKWVVLGVGSGVSWAMRSTMVVKNKIGM